MRAGRHGRGFDPTAVESRGFGLTNIAQRVQILGGAHKISSVPGQGTTITIRLDLPQKTSEHVVKENLLEMRAILTGWRRAAP